MKLLVLAFFVVLTISAYAENQNDWVEIDWSKVVPITEAPGFWEGREIEPALYPKGSKRSGRIVGGQVVVPNSHPYQAALIIDGSNLCGGSLISSNVILTAAHCPTGSGSTLVIMGAHYWRDSTESTQQRRTVQSAQYRVHENYNPSNLNKDVAILIILSPFDLNQYVAIIPRFKNDEFSDEDFNGATALTSGWGRTETGKLSPNLRSVENTVISNSDCAAVYGTSVFIDSTLCISTTGAKGTCNGDSGGPLTTVVDDVRYLIGVTSFVAGGMCTAEHPAGFSRIASFNNWIDAH